jgi:hypothetical protein
MNRTVIAARTARTVVEVSPTVNIVQLSMSVSEFNALTSVNQS